MNLTLKNAGVNFGASVFSPLNNKKIYDAFLDCTVGNQD